MARILATYAAFARMPEALVIREGLKEQRASYLMKPSQGWSLMAKSRLWVGK